MKSVTRHSSVAKPLTVVQLSDGVERIGEYVFQDCRFTQFRSPPLVTTIPRGMLWECSSLFSLEVPINIIQVGSFACDNCCVLRNVDLASNTVVSQNAFSWCNDLLKIFGTVDAIVHALKSRFDGLLIHSKIYYISYHKAMTSSEIIIGENG